MKVYRLLIYEGEPKWIKTTLKFSLNQGRDSTYATGAGHTISSLMLNDSIAQHAQEMQAFSSLQTEKEPTP